MDTMIARKNLSEKEKEDLLREILGTEYTSVGNNLPILRNVIDVVGHVDTAFTLAELVPIINGALSGSRVIAFVSTGASIFSIFMFPVAALISVANAYQVGHKMYSFRSIAYTLSAWAFDKPIPVSSKRVLSNMRRGMVVVKKEIIDEHNKLWSKTSKNVITKLNAELVTKKIPQDAMKILLRAIANNNEQKLCELILKGFEKEFSSVVKITWRNNYKIKFPN